MKKIETLVDDIYALIREKGGVGNILAGKPLIIPDRDGSEAPRLRLSGLGPKCPCHFWHSIHTPELAEELPPWASMKYAYGHLIEQMVLELAAEAGHTVEGMQDEVVLDGVTGHRDAIIDGVLVDVKSSSSYGLAKFKDGSIAQDDPFGYLDQLDGYLDASAADPKLLVKDYAYIIAVDKTLGHIVMYKHKKRDGVRKRIAELKAILAQPSPPACTCGTVPDGKSGNMRLDMKASYSPFKFCCFPNLRVFLYSDGPKYLTKVVKAPQVKEIDRHGKDVTQPQ